MLNSGIVDEVFMNNKRPQNSIDGFALRRRTPQPGGTGFNGRRANEDMRVPDRFLHDGNLPRPVITTEQPNRQGPEQSRPVIAADRHETQAQPNPAAGGIRRSEIDASLNSIDEPSGPRKKRRRGGSHPSRKKLIKRIVIAILVLLIALGAFMAIKAVIASSKVFNGSIFDLLGAGQELKTDKYGRSNVLIFGTSEDDPDHAGGNLTDSIMVLSLDQKNKNAAMVSIPRDLWVKYGDACSSGYEGKINALYECKAGSNNDQKAGAEGLKDKAGEILGMDVQYYAQVNYTVVREVVDAVGGVTVTIESDDPRGILDRNFDWKCRYRCYYVKYPNGPVNLDGEHALALARARNASGGYGLGGGNFDREQYQQKIIKALKEKATSAGTLANPAAVTGIIDALGDNVRTNFSGGEVKTLISLANDIPNEKIKSISLVEEGNAVVTTGNISGQSVVKPVAGTYDFSEIETYVRAKLSALNGSENGEVAILNGSTQMGVAGDKADELKEVGINVSSVGDTDANNYPSISWYDLTGGKQPKLAAKLKETLGVESSGSKLPSGVHSHADFVIIIGDGAN